MIYLFSLKLCIHKSLHYSQVSRARSLSIHTDSFSDTYRILHKAANITAVYKPQCPPENRAVILMPPIKPAMLLSALGQIPTIKCSRQKYSFDQYKAK